MKLEIFSSAIETSRELILRIVELMNEDSEKMFNLAVSGGDAAALVFDLWANEYRELTPWHRLRVYWVDECCVPPEHAESYYGTMCNLLFGVVPIPYENVYRIRGEVSPSSEVERYEQVVKNQVPLQKGCPEFDLVLLGAGEDGHTASIFPGKEEFLSTPALYATCVNPQTGRQWVTMTGGPLLNARRVFFLITGKNKASVLKDIYLSGDTGSAAYIAHHAKEVELYVDKWAASLVSAG